MHEIWHDVRDHPRTVLFFVIAWAVVWTVTVLTWHFDAAGRSQGVPPRVFFAHLALPLVAAGLISVWSKHRYVRDSRGVRSHFTGLPWVVLTGVVVAAADFAIFIGWDQMLFALGRVVPPSQHPPSGPTEAAVMFVLFLVIGVVAGLIALGVTRSVGRR